MNKDNKNIKSFSDNKLNISVENFFNILILTNSGKIKFKTSMENSSLEILIKLNDKNIFFNSSINLSLEIFLIPEIFFLMLFITSVS